MGALQIRRRRDAAPLHTRHRLTFSGLYQQDPDGAWFISVPELDVATSAFAIDKIEAAVRHLVAPTLDVDETAST